jgi:hypothetical protein
MSDGPFHNAEHNDNGVKWRPVTRRKVVHTDQGPIVLIPGKDVELYDEYNGVSWGNKPDDFIRRYRLDERGRAIFEKHYPGVLK